MEYSGVGCGMSCRSHEEMFHAAFLFLVKRANWKAVAVVVPGKALEASTGEELKSSARPQVTSSSSPHIAAHDSYIALHYIHSHSLHQQSSHGPSISRYGA